MPDPQVSLAGTTTDRVTATLRDEILAGVFPPGTRVKILDLAARYGISPLPVREALVRLEGEGLLDLTAHRGAAVRPLSAKLLADTYDVRGALEALLAARATERADGPALRHLGSLQQRWEAAAATVDPKAIFDANSALHAAIATLGDNPEAQRLSAQGFRLIVALRGRLGFSAARLDAVRREHRALLAALRVGDAARAGQAALSHCRAARDDLLAELDATGLLPTRARHSA